MFLKQFKANPLCLRAVLRLRSLCLLMLALSIFLAVPVARAQPYPDLKDKIHFVGKQIPVIKFLQSLQEQTGYIFSYEKAAIADIILPDVAFDSATLGYALEYLEKKADLRFQVYNKNIGVQRAHTAEGRPAASRPGGLQSEVRGRVTDSLGGPLAGATVMIKGTSRGTSTNGNGDFVLENVKTNAVLVVSYTGFVSREVSTGGLSTLNIILKEDVASINNIVVTALGIERQSKSLGYSTQRIKGDEFQNTKELNLANDMVGKVAGLEVNASTEMFISSDIRLRGLTPLIVVDGSPINAGTWDLNYNDIESVDVLKGPAAASLYGSAGINGAIIITLKKGRANRNRVEFTSTDMIQPSLLASPKVQTEYGEGSNGKYQYVNGSGAGIEGGGFNWGPKLDGSLIAQWDSPIDSTTGQRIPIPWVDHSGGKGNLVKFLRTGFITENNVNFETSSDKGSFRMSASQEREIGIVPNTSLNIYGFSMGGRHVFSDYFTVNASLNYSKQYSPNYRTPSYGSQDYIYSLAFWLGPDINLDDARNYWAPGAVGIQQRFAQTGYYNNPYFLTYENTHAYDKDVAYGQISGDISFIPKVLSLKLRIGANANGIRSTTKTAKGTTGTPLGNYAIADSRNFTVDNDAILSFDKRVSKALAINAIAGASYYYNSATTDNLSTNGLVNPLFYSMSNSLNPVSNSNSLNESQTKSLYANVNLQFWKPLYLTLTGRNDWVSTLPVVNNSYFYPSASLSLVLSDWLKLPKAVSFLKLRGSVAQVNTGNTGSTYGQVQTYAVGTYNSMPTMTTPRSLVPSNILPAASKNYEAGGNIGLFQNRVNLDVNYYNRLDYNNIISESVSITSGYQSELANGRKYDTRGWEFALNTVPVKNNDFSWNLGVNLWEGHKYLKALENGLKQDGYIKLGARTDQIYAYPFLRNSKGQLILISGSGLPQFDPYVRYSGNYDPNFMYGIQTSLRYKSLTLSLAGDGRVGGKYYSILPRMVRAGTSTNYDHKARADQAAGLSNYVGPGVVITGGSVQYDGLGNIISDSRQYATNTVTTNYQSWEETIGNLGGNDSDDFLHADYFKLRDITLAWSIPQKVLSKVAVSNAEISVFASNVFIITRKASLGDDPSWEVGEGTENSNLKSPTARSFGAQLKLTF